MGRRPTPKAILDARGSRNATRPRRSREPAPIAPQAEHPPDWLDAEGKACWEDYRTLFFAQGILSETDSRALGLLAAAWSEFRRYWDDVEKNGISYTTANGGEGLRPVVRQMNRARETFIGLAKEFGATPSARANVKADQKKSGGDDPANKYRVISGA